MNIFSLTYINFSKYFFFCYHPFHLRCKLAFIASQKFTELLRKWVQDTTLNEDHMLIEISVGQTKGLTVCFRHFLCGHRYHSLFQDRWRKVAIMYSGKSYWVLTVTQNDFISTTKRIRVPFRFPIMSSVTDIPYV